MAREEIKARERRGGGGGKGIPFRFGNTCRGIIPLVGKEGLGGRKEGDVSDRQSALLERPMITRGRLRCRYR